jgi:cytochrome c oxidase assembly protein subunit 15
MERALRTLSIIGTIGMFIVLLMGATVTDTGSSEGCGRSWPLCHGNFLPAGIRESVIEFSHRLVTGIIGIVIFALAVLCIRARKKYPQLLPLVPMMVGALLLQSVMGAWAVKYPQSAPVLAMHFGFSLVAVAGVFLVMRVIDESQAGSRTIRPIPTREFRIATWLSVVAVYVVAYSGAYMKHVDAVDDGCRTWPLCNGQVVPELGGDDGVVFMHRLAALAGTFLIAGIAWIAWRHRQSRPDLANTSLLALWLVLAQIIAGMLVVRTDMQLIATLMHAGIMAALFLTLCENCRLALPQRAVAPAFREQPLSGHASTAPAD